MHDVSVTTPAAMPRYGPGVAETSDTTAGSIAGHHVLPISLCRTGVFKLNEPVAITQCVRFDDPQFDLGRPSWVSDGRGVGEFLRSVY